MTLRERLASIQERAQAAAHRSRFGVRPIDLIAVSKAHSVTSIRNLYELGCVKMGENYAQELLGKAPLCQDVEIQWHFVGQLQSNKVRHLLPLVSSIDSVDSIELARKIARLREKLQPTRPPVPIMLQVNLGNERQKSGLPPKIVEELFPKFMEENGVMVTGLMTIPPFYKDPEKLRPHFKLMKELFDRLKEKHSMPRNFRYLSMGMSRDFEIAIEEGSNCIRIGEALFGPRPSTAQD